MNWSLSSYYFVFKKQKSHLKELEGNLNREDNIQSYNIYKKELDSIYNHIAEGIRIRSTKCDWYEHGEKPTKFFLNLEKKRYNQNQICKLIIDEKEIDADAEMLSKSKVSTKHFSKVRLSKM